MSVIRSTGLLRTIVLAVLVGLCVISFPLPAHASLHTYRERPGQVTVRSRQSLRDYNDRAWQAIAFKRTQGTALQGIYMRLVGFPGTVEVNPQQPIWVTAPTGQHWQLPWSIDPQTRTLPVNAGQYNLQPLLEDVRNPLPLEMQLSLAGDEVVEWAIAPFIVKEWLQVKTAKE
ncbi:DUF3122 domain-containing protein [Oscillatoria sp. CS-180]|uniref:DUF3122 domain-containing protein n=1 Tax=Oscillatoria sp. CS-180 TaxID=3021720 RepID=UPI00232FC986|nr:DUF3122 domain-containing protein [Oscillatoria sp. CS-180]MDB9525967.1 DUF3122 domain-containing protein [Oscillatoria sp. CS-180]